MSLPIPVQSFLFFFLLVQELTAFPHESSSSDRSTPFNSLPSSKDPKGAGFTSWEHLLTKTTRSGKSLSQIPNFVAFCRNHQFYATQLLKEDNCPSDDVDRMIPNLLQGGRSAGPIVQTCTQGQYLRVLMAYPDGVLTARTKPFNTNTIRWSG
jgi:hypothetical protein